MLLLTALRCRPNHLVVEVVARDALCWDLGGVLLFKDTRGDPDTNGTYATHRTKPQRTGGATVAIGERPL